MKMGVSSDPRGMLWRNNKNGLGFKLMEKMGWKDGEGLGANGDGITENLKVHKKRDNAGIGVKKDVHGVWLDNAQDFSKLLANLNAVHNTNVPEKVVENQETDAKKSKKDAKKSSKKRKREERWSYKRIIKQKDTQNYKEDDMNAITGVSMPSPKRQKIEMPDQKKTKKAKKTKKEKKKKSKSKKSKKANKLKTKSDPPKKSTPGTDLEQTTTAVPLITSTVSLEDYFASKT